MLLRVYNTTAIAYINKMGGIQFQVLNKLAKEIWTWCEERNIWIFASYISSRDNFEADFESRRLEPETEYALSSSAFREIEDSFGRPAIDLFATRTNAKCVRYVSWSRDPGSIAVDAFTLDWNECCLCVSAVCNNFASFKKNQRRRGERNSGGPSLAGSSLVPRLLCHVRLRADLF